MQIYGVYRGRVWGLLTVHLHTYHIKTQLIMLFKKQTLKRPRPSPTTVVCHYTLDTLSLKVYLFELG